VNAVNKITRKYDNVETKCTNWTRKDATSAVKITTIAIENRRKLEIYEAKDQVRTRIKEAK